ncbi:MAG: hypothetical protein LBI13_06505 [Streptococcaceae bacterium]|jgi:hypothetical protein|nr:hypothetical protein [Streptococcaceae bacterium]
MTTKEEWLEYFEAINGRKPRAEEFLAAKKNGEITGETHEEYLVGENARFIEPKIEDKRQIKPISSYTMANRNPNRAVDKKSGAIFGVVFGPICIIGGIMIWQFRASTYSSLDVGQSIRNLGIIGVGIMLLVMGLYNLNKK